MHPAAESGTWRLPARRRGGRREDDLELLRHNQGQRWVLPVAVVITAIGWGGCGDGGVTPSDASAVVADAADAAPATEAAPGRDAAGEGPPDAGTDRPADDFCRAWDDCPADRVCDFALGRCEQRALLPADVTVIDALKPTAAAPGDLLVIDGQRFYTGIMGSLSVQVSIAGVTIPGSLLAVDENRIVVNLTAVAAGAVQVSGNGGAASSTELLAVAPEGLLPCGADRPAASGWWGQPVTATGPYAAGYLDYAAPKARLYYPATCGSLRRPPVPGTWPLVALLHGDGAVPLNYEYLGQYLATWGFVSVTPSSDDTGALVALLDELRGVDLGPVASPVLAGVVTTAEVGLIGHSRGSARLQGIVADPELRDATVASVFLGPVDDGVVVPSPFMVFGATGDLQSRATYYDACYARQPAPKWKLVIQGGNHSLFTDHKVWLGVLVDDPPTIFRADQFRIVTAFVLPLLERGFGLPEHFSDRLDQPPPDPLYVVAHEP